jgi:hypothetical protein
MDYGDELNDQEEREYKAELKANKENAGDGSGEEDGESEEGEEESSEEVFEPKVLPKRSTRGQRMNALVGQAIKEDEDFYNTGIFAAKEAGQEDSDIDFNSAEVSSDARRDSFDSDFS